MRPSTVSVVILYDYQKRDGASLASLVYSSTEINSSDDDSVFFLLLQYSILSFRSFIILLFLQRKRPRVVQQAIRCSAVQVAGSDGAVGRRSRGRYVR